MMLCCILSKGGAHSQAWSFKAVRCTTQHISENRIIFWLRTWLHLTSSSVLSYCSISMVILIIWLWRVCCCFYKPWTFTNHFSLLTDSGLGNDIKQFPLHVFQNQGQSGRLTCSHSYSSYNTIIWYKQSQDGGLKYLGYLSGDSETLETEFKNTGKISLDGNGRANSNGSLTINKLVPNDSAAYYCAASEHSATTQLWFEQKPFSVLLKLPAPVVALSPQFDSDVITFPYMTWSYFTCSE